MPSAQSNSAQTTVRSEAPATLRGPNRPRHDMVDAPAEVPLEGVTEEIPVGVLNEIGVELAEDVNKIPPNAPSVFMNSPGPHSLTHA